jgi:hypothetical protein
MPNYISGADTSLVPFGKYRGQPIDVMLADRGYLEWVLAQPGIVAMIQGKYPALFNIITVGAPATDDTPEHNKLQAMFLDPDFQYAFLEIIVSKSIYAIAEAVARECQKRTATALQEAILQVAERIEDWKEKRESFAKYGTAYERALKEAEEQLTTTEALLSELHDYPSGVLEPMQPKISLEFECGYDVDFFAYWPFRYRQWRGFAHTKWTCTSIELFEHWRDYDSEKNYLVNRSTGQSRSGYVFQEPVACRIELKPQMGDDFPAVLRQVKRNGANVLVIDSFGSSNCTLDQVRAIFGPIRIITLAEIQAIRECGVWPAASNSLAT